MYIAVLKPVSVPGVAFAPSSVLALLRAVKTTFIIIGVPFITGGEERVLITKLAIVSLLARLLITVEFTLVAISWRLFNTDWVTL